jgi:hypothetical protein
MNNLGCYERMKFNYDLAKKYYLMAIEKGNSQAMNNLGCYYTYTEKNYDLAKKYFLMAIDKGYTDAMNNLGYYYEEIEKNWSLAKKYYLMGIKKHSYSSIIVLDHHYINNIFDNDDQRNYLYAIIEGNFRFKDINLLRISNIKSFECVKNNLFCKILNLYNLNVDDFSFCVLNIINNFKRDKNELDDINNFMEYLSKIYYKSKKKLGEYRRERQICLQNILNTNIQISQLFMEYLDQHYYKYLEKIYKPGFGSGYIKTKKHFESIVAKATK